MLSRRELVNLGVFLAMFLVMCAWAAQNVVSFDFLERPYRISAQFATSPGLRGGYEVTYLGVAVGDVSAVKLDTDRVTAVLELDRGVDLPAQLDASVRRKSAVGEPYVNLAPTGGVDPGGARLEAGTVIPLERTTTPPDYSQLFNALVDVIDAVPVDDLGRLIHSLAAGFEGRSDDLRSIFANVDRFTGTLAANAPLLEAVAGDVTHLTHTFAENRDLIGEGWANLASLTQMLVERKDTITALLERAPSMADQFYTLLREAGPSIACSFDVADRLWTGLNTESFRQGIGRVAELAPVALDVLKRSYWEGPGGPYLTATLRFDLVSVAGSLLEGGGAYPVPHELPVPTDPAPCTVPAITGVIGPEAGTGAGGAAPVGGGTATNVPTRVSPAPGEQDSSSQQPDPGTDLFDLARNFSVLAGAIGLVVLIATVRPWRFLPFLARLRSEDATPAVADPGEAAELADERLGS
ncbi:MAG: MCE family protein [Acidimicrobiales bacterium]